MSKADGEHERRYPRTDRRRAATVRGLSAWTCRAVVPVRQPAQRGRRAAAGAAWSPWWWTPPWRARCSRHSSCRARWRRSRLRGTRRRTSSGSTTLGSPAAHHREHRTTASRSPPRAGHRPPRVVRSPPPPPPRSATRTSSAPACMINSSRAGQRSSNTPMRISLVIASSISWISPVRSSPSTNARHGSSGSGGFSPRFHTVRSVRPSEYSARLVVIS